MISSFIITVAGTIDGATGFEIPFDPPSVQPLAEPETGLIRVAIAGNAGVLRMPTLAPWVGAGGFFLTGCSLTTVGGSLVSIAMISPDVAASTRQNLYPLAQPAPVPYRYRPTYVPAGWRLLFEARLGDDAQTGVIRLDVMPTPGPKPGRPIAASRLLELVPST